MIKIRDRENCLLVEIEGDLTPEGFSEAIKDIDLAGPKGVVISGRGPIWAYGMLIHLAHPTPWVATFDPRLEGTVVVASHTANRRVGEVIPS